VVVYSNKYSKILASIQLSRQNHSMFTAVLTDAAWVHDPVADVWYCPDEADPDWWWQQEALAEVESLPADAWRTWKEQQCAFESWSDARLGEITRLEAEISALQGAQLVQQAAFVRAAVERVAADPDADEDDRDAAGMSAMAQIGMALEVAAKTGDRRTEEALDLTARLPRTLQALCDGRITLAKARVIAAETRGLTAAETAIVEAKLLGLAAGSTPGALRYSARSIVARINSDALRKREKEAKAEREVTVYRHPHKPGMSVFSAVLPTAQAQALFGIVDAYAHAQKQARTPGDDRLMGACRADALYDLVTNPYGQGSRISYEIGVVVPAGALLGINDEPGYLPGHGPIPAALCRELAADATWRRILTDPDTGHLLDLGPQRYRPSERLREFVQVRDQHCRFPGCRRRARRCEVDHTIEFGLPGGDTIRINTGCLCKKHHDIKGMPGWDLIQDADGSGALTWITPTGQRYRTRPPDITTGEDPATENLGGPPPPAPPPGPPSPAQPAVRRLADDPPF
jgi:hypothetical protein